MDGWMEYEGKRIFLRTRKNRVYSGVVTNVDSDSNALRFLTLLDIKGMRVTFALSEIVEIKEEQNGIKEI